MMGGGKVSPIPIAMSLATTFFSAITILSTPVEYYRFGTMFTYFIICYLICTILAAEVFGPMYKKFGLTSLYEYLELRIGIIEQYF
jgi:sodium-coupled monocarboxylate transporter 8/12